MGFTKRLSSYLSLAYRSQAKVRINTFSQAKSLFLFITSGSYDAMKNKLPWQQWRVTHVLLLHNGQETSLYKVRRIVRCDDDEV